MTEIVQATRKIEYESTYLIILHDVAQHGHGLHKEHDLVVLGPMDIQTARYHH